MNTQQIAQQMLDANPVILDTETTGLDKDDQIIEIAIIDTHGNTYLNHLVKATKPSHPKAFEVHGISQTVLDEHGLPWADLLPTINTTFDIHPVAIYNATFDTRLIAQTCAAHFTNQPAKYQTFDIMELANRHFVQHAKWDTENSRFKRLSLTRCCELAGVKFDGNAHRAVVDCHATLDLLKFMAQDTATQQTANDDVLVIEVES